VTVDEGRRVTLAGIAQEAGVSVLTVSRVLNGRSDAPPHTRERVEDLLNRYGYQRETRRAWVTAGLIDVVLEELADLGGLEVIRGVEEVAHQSGVGAVVSANHGRSTAAGQWLRNLRNRATDGIVVVGADLASPVYAELRRLDVPIVLVDPAHDAPPEAPTIDASNAAGARQATEHLVSLGHYRIAAITGPPSRPSSRARRDGWRDTLAAAGIPVRDEFVRVGDFSVESGYQTATALLDLDRPPTAIFAAGDQMALGAYEAIRRAGLRVPDDVSVVGFDDSPAARFAGPPLTTIRQPLVQMGLLAAHTLLRLVHQERLEQVHVELATELVARGSAARPPD